MSKRIIFTLLACTSALLACGPTKKAQVPAQDQPQTQRPVQPVQESRSLGVYVADITTSKNGMVNASVRPLDSEGDLSATATTSTTRGVTGLNIIVNNTSVINSGGKRYYTTTLTIDNQSGKDIALPTFIPLGVNGASFFKGAKNSSGDSVSLATTDITFSQGWQNSSGVAQIDNFATRLAQYPHGLTTADFTVPAGQTINSVHSGAVWLAPPILAGTTETVQFGFEISNNNVFRFSLVFGVADSVYLDRAQPTSLAGYTWHGESRRKPNTEELKVVIESNKVRKQSQTCGSTVYPPVPPLIWNEKLAHVALNHSVDMSKNKYFDHVTPNGIKLPARYNGVGYEWIAGGENLAHSGGDMYLAANVVADWLGSVIHCKGLMSNTNDVGVGAYINGTGAHTDGKGFFWTQNFGSTNNY